MSRKLLDLSGRTFGLWTVLHRDTTKPKKVYFECRCKCGKIHSVRSDALLLGRSKGCLSCVRTVNHAGQIFGHWLVLMPKTTNMRSGWLCRCLKCGTEKVIDTGNLVSGKSTQCRKCGSNTIHGQSGTRLYGIYHHIISRCYTKTCDCYADYGGRGISVCDEWRNNFAKFSQWALENGYNDSLTIDRIDVNKGYSPDNCRWVTNTEQQRSHKRTLVELTLHGVTKCLSEWSRTTGMSSSAIKARLARGWSVEKALSTPPLTGPYAKTPKNPT